MPTSRLPTIAAITRKPFRPAMARRPPALTVTAARMSCYPRAIPKSRVNHANIPATCGTCHGQKYVMEASGHSAQPFSSYLQSVHGKAVASGSEKAAVCTDCHGAHEILAATDDKSPIFRFNVPATCAKCHDDVKQEFMQSIHGQAIARGNGQAPVCTDCHGIHSIKDRKDPNSSVAAANLASITCARCHEGVRLTQEFGVRRPPFYHLPGQLSRAGFEARFPDRGQLRKLPRRAQHSALQRPAIHHQPRQSGEHLRPVPSRSHREVCASARSTSMPLSPPTSVASRCAGSASFISA